MLNLAEMQRDIAASLLEPSLACRAARWLEGEDESVARQLAIYRTNVAATAARALSAAYPVIQQIVGIEFFDSLARAYQRANPSTSGNLYEYGSCLAGFLSEFTHTQTLPYLPDVAALEWAVHQAHGARNADAWDTRELLRVEPDRQSSIRFEWAPGTAIVSSEFPIVRIWNIHQPEYSDTFTVDWKMSEGALVAREGLRVAVTALTTAESVFVKCLLAGGNLAGATGVSMLADESFDLSAVLSRSLASGAICGYWLDGTH